MIDNCTHVIPLKVFHISVFLPFKTVLFTVYLQNLDIEVCAKSIKSVNAIITNV